MVMISPGSILIHRKQNSIPQWQNSVVYIFESHKNGNAGLVLNKGTGRYLQQVLLEHNLKFAAGSVEINVGGPVNPRGLIMIHTDEFSSSTSMPVRPGVAVSSDDFMIHKMCSGELPKGFKIFAGHSAWGPGQLQKEIDQGVWLTHDHIPATMLFDAENHVIYDACVEMASKMLFDQYL